jgi:hypothetical protein
VSVVCEWLGVTAAALCVCALGIGLLWRLQSLVGGGWGHMGRGFLAAAAAAVDAAGSGGHVRLEDLCCHPCMLWSVVVSILEIQQKPRKYRLCSLEKGVAGLRRSRLSL